jgi:hypothetical protein
MMAEMNRRPARHYDAGGRRGRLAQRVIGAAYLAVGLGAVIFALVTWLLGRLNPINLLVFALAVAGTAPAGLLAWQGDYPGSRHMDEGQREMNLAAQSNAFYVAYTGLYALFFGYILIPETHGVMPVLIGALLLLVMLTWLVGYMWRRWRPL